MAKTTSNTWIRRPRPVKAFKWTGDNFTEAQIFCELYLGKESGPYTSYDEYDGKNTLQFYAWNDDQEVDPGRWVVVYVDRDDEGVIMRDAEFLDDYVQERELNES